MCVCVRDDSCCIDSISSPGLSIVSSTAGCQSNLSPSFPGRDLNWRSTVFCLPTVYVVRSFVQPSVGLGGVHAPTGARIRSVTLELCTHARSHPASIIIIITMGIYENLSRISFDSYHESYYRHTDDHHCVTKRTNIAAYPNEYFEVLNHETPLKLWLTELQSLTEVESLSALQAKSVATTPESFEALSIRNAQIAIHQLRQNSADIIDELDAIIDSLPVTFDGLNYLVGTFQETYRKIASVIETCRRKGCDHVAKRQVSTELATNCDYTLRTMYSFLSDNDFNNSQIEASIRTVKENFGEMIDGTIKKECQVSLLDTIEPSNC